MKTNGATFKCDRCGQEKFISDAEILIEGGLTALGIYKLTIPRKKDIHFCETCFMDFIEFMNQKEINFKISIGGQDPGNDNL